MLSRRRAVLVLASAAVLPLSLQACGRAGGGGGGMDTASEALTSQHGVLLRILAVYRRAALGLRINPAAVDAPALAQAADLFRTYGEDFHERGLEETFVFPKLRKAGGATAALVDQLLQQHERGRALTDFIHQHCSGGQVPSDQAEPVARALESMAGMYEAHIAFEDSVVYPAWRGTLSASEAKGMAQRFADLQRGRFKADGLEAAQTRMSAIERVLGVKDASTYTPPLPQAAQSGDGPGQSDAED